MPEYDEAIILDDHPLFADSFSLLLEKLGLFKNITTFSEPRDFLDYVLKVNNRKVFIFLDFYLKDANGIAVYKEIRRISKKSSVFFVTSSVSPSVLTSIQLVRPQGILSKYSDLSEIHAAIAHHPNETYIDMHILNVLQTYEQKPVTFSAREIEILIYFEQGMSNKEAADLTFLSVHTVIAHRRKMMAKVGAKTIGQLIKYAKDYGVI